MEEEKKAPRTRTPVSGENAYAILAYLWILCLVPLLMKKEGEFVRFHVRQGLILFIVEIGVAIIGIIPILGPVIYTLGILVCALLSLAGIVQVLMGNKWKMPVIGEWAEKINV